MGNFMIKSRRFSFLQEIEIHTQAWEQVVKMSLT